MPRRATGASSLGLAVLVLSLIGAGCAGAPSGAPDRPVAAAATSQPSAVTNGATSPAGYGPTAGATPSIAPAAALPAGSAPAFARGTVSIHTQAGPVTLQVEIADDEAKREYGLMNRQSLAPDRGMLFVFTPPADAKRIGFWMKDTLIPLSIAFVEPAMTVESVQDMDPLSETIHYAPRDYVYAIEANRGYFASHGVAVGDRVTIGG